MSLVEIPILTVDQKKEESAKRINILCAHAFNHLLKTHDAIKDEIFKNKEGLTPQEVMEGVGRNGEQLLALNEQLKALVNGLKPGAIADLPPNVQFMLNGDKTVSITIS